jgi:hypothetical protein
VRAWQRKQSKEAPSQFKYHRYHHVKAGQVHRRHAAHEKDDPSDGAGATLTHDPDAGTPFAEHPHTLTTLSGGQMLHQKASELHGNTSAAPGLQQTASPSPNNTFTEAFGAAQGLTPDQIDNVMNYTDNQIIDTANRTNVSMKEELFAIGGGTGATIGGTGILELDLDLVRRMRYQDKAVMILLLVMYFVTLGFSASFAYRQSLNNSPVTFYADPRFHDMVMEGRDRDTFLENFSGSPKDVHLQVTGYIPVSSGVLGSIEWQGEYYYDAFSFALDLSPWVVREATSDGADTGSWHDNLQLVNGVAAVDMESLHHYVSRDRNDLAIVEVHKEVAWTHWEELATNIKHKIRQEGFNGVISVHKTDCDTVNVYKNTAWANFMHSRTTKVLCALSVLGWVIYLPYMWLRCTTTAVRARYTIDIPISNYWQLIQDKLTVDGFVEDPDAVRASVARQQETVGQLTTYGTGRIAGLGDVSEAPSGLTAGWDSDSMSMMASSDD